MQYSATTLAPHVLPPDRLRALALGRRVSASPEVAAVLAILAFGEPRDPVPALPTSVGRSRS